jgi:hypothetical protein
MLNKYNIKIYFMINLIIFVEFFYLILEYYVKIRVFLTEEELRHAHVLPMPFAHDRADRVRG